MWLVGKMCYDKKKDLIADMIKKCVDEGAYTEDITMILVSTCVEVLYDVASELHEINKNVRAGVDDGR